MFRRLYNLTPLSYTHFIEHLPRILFSTTTTTTTDEITKLLQNKCKLSHSTALSITNKLSESKSPPNPNSITKLLQIFQNFNFSAANIASVITKQPRILLLDPDEKIKATLQYFQTIALHPDTVSSCPLILRANLQNRIVPNVELLRSLLPDSNSLQLTLKRAPGFLIRDLDKLLLPIVVSMREHKVSSNVISTLLVSLAGRVARTNFRDVGAAFKSIKEMNISPSSSIFAHALVVLAHMTEREWERKLDIYKGLGWSKEQVVAAFARHPYCMVLSDEKMIRNARYFSETLGWGANSMCVYSVLLSCSLDKRIVPRYEIWQILAAKGLVRPKPNERYFIIPHSEFTRRYVVKYQHQAPEVLPIFKTMEKRLDGSNRKLKTRAKI